MPDDPHALCMSTFHAIAPLWKHVLEDSKGKKKPGGFFFVRGERWGEGGVDRFGGEGGSGLRGG